MSDAGHVEQPRIPSTNVLPHVKPRHRRPNYRVQPAARGHGAPGAASVPERAIPPNDVRPLRLSSVHASLTHPPFPRANPESLRMMLQMSQAMRGGSLSGLGGAGSFPAPGLPSTARQPGQDQQPQTGSTPSGAPNPAAGVPPLFFPFAPPPPAGGSNPTSPGAQGAAPGAGAGAGMFDPALMQQMLAAMGGGAGAGAGAGAAGADPFGLGGFGGLGAFGGAPAAPANTRPPEERFQVQLQVSSSLMRCNAQVETSIRVAATARYGLHKLSAERACAPGDRWKCPLCH